MKRLILILFVYLFETLPSYSIKSHSFPIDSILNVLYNEIDQRNTYYNSRDLRISNLKLNISNQVSASNMERFNSYSRIFDEYQSYQFDSAYVYVNKMIDIASNIKNDSLLNQSRYYLTFIYTSAGLFTDADKTINSMHTTSLSNQQLATFYNLYARVYSDMSNFQDKLFSDKYAHLYYAYTDSALQYAQPGSFLFKLLLSCKGTNREKIQKYTTLLKSQGMESQEKAIVCSILGDIYKSENDLDASLFYKAWATIIDIKSATRETSAKKDIAEIFYEKGDVSQASFFIQLALEDANFYNSRHRKVEICNILPLIEQARFNAMKSQKNTMTTLMGVTIILCILLVIAVYYISKQVKASRAACATISYNKDYIQKQCEDLELANTRLIESERVKDEYIGNTFYVYASSLGRIEKIYKMINRKVVAKQYDDLKNMFTDTDLDKEREQIYSTFDEGFLRLFPNFIQQYNELFKENDKVITPTPHSLNVEMRIFALIRLRVTDTEKIAQFLNYSVNTINTYKTKAKNRSIVPNTEFEQRIMSI